MLLRFLKQCIILDSYLSERKNLHFTYLRSTAARFEKNEYSLSWFVK